MERYLLRDEIWWTGAVDWDIRDFHGYETSRGTSYNAYLILDEQVALIDGCRDGFGPEMLRRVQGDWLKHHPPRYPDEPYHIRLIMAYADRAVGHEGTIYRAANFELWGQTNNTRRRHTTRGEDDGNVKLIYVYRLQEPRWKYEPPQIALPLSVEWAIETEVQP